MTGQRRTRGGPGGGGSGGGGSGGGRGPGTPGGQARPPGVIRRGQAITTWGPGALLDLPTQSVIMGGLDTWPPPTSEEVIDEPRLSRRLGNLPLHAPPRPPERDHERSRGIVAYRFPEWFVVQERSEGQEELSRRLVPRGSLESPGGRFDGLPVVATRFVTACARGHIDDVPWRRFAHGGRGGVATARGATGGDAVAGAVDAGVATAGGTTCGRQLWLDEEGTGGDLADLVVRCECGARRKLIEARTPEDRALGACTGRRPWLGGRNTEAGCAELPRLLNRFAANLYFSQVRSVLSLPADGTALERAVEAHWVHLGPLTKVEQVATVRAIYPVLADLAPATDEEVLAQVVRARAPSPPESSVKDDELDALLDAPVGHGDGYPGDQAFLARRLPRGEWHRDARCEALEAVVQVHRLREVVAMTGFTRIDAVMQDPTTGEFDVEKEPAPIATNLTWYPAVESRGEGIFVQVSAGAIGAWLARPAVVARVAALARAFARWKDDRKASWPFPGGPYVMLHTLSHLLMQSLAVRCGYPASALKERVYVDPDRERYGFLVFTSTADVAGTLGGLVVQAHAIEDHVLAALAEGGLCSNDPVCALHDPTESLERRYLHGAACHGCTLVGEMSCEARNEFLDRALVVPVIGLRAAALFGGDA